MAKKKSDTADATADAPEAPAGRRFRASTPGMPHWEGEAADEADAVAKMQAEYGILHSDHGFAAEPID
jgi:hypothetical protein